MRTTIMIPFLAAALLVPSAATPACPKGQPCPTGEPVSPVIDLFRGPLSFKSAEGVVQGCVVMQQWQIANEETTEIPHQGLLIIHLRAGALTTEINGEWKKWNEGSLWSVPAEERLIVHTVRDSVVLQTVDFVKRECPLRGAGVDSGALPLPFYPPSSAVQETPPDCLVHVKTITRLMW
jgi:hypothetical protein